MPTIIYERIEPLTPIREPIVTSRGFSNMKPRDVSFDISLEPRGHTFGYKRKSSVLDMSGSEMTTVAERLTNKH